MSPRRKRSIGRQITDQDMREQEVLRANRELAAYFRGKRTEREARAALKIIKAFVRQREREREKPPLPGKQRAREKPTTILRKRSKSARKTIPIQEPGAQQPDEQD